MELKIYHTITNKLIYKTDSENELTDTSGEGWEKGIVRAFGMDIYIQLYLKWISNKVLLYSTGIKDSAGNLISTVRVTNFIIRQGK